MTRDNFSFIRGNDHNVSSLNNFDKIRVETGNVYFNNTNISLQNKSTTMTP